MTQYVISLDFDGCVFNEKYAKLLQNKLLIRDQAIFQANEPLLEYLLNNILSKFDTTFFVGSNRQSHSLDFLNGQRNHFFEPNLGSCFSALLSIHYELKRRKESQNAISTFDIKIDKSLTADFFNDKELGYSFNHALTHPNWQPTQQFTKKEQSGENHDDKEANKKYIQEEIKKEIKVNNRESDPETIADQTKITLLYAQCHKSAIDAANDENVIFEFIDDRDDILYSIHSFYTEHADLLPSKVTLKMTLYNNGNVPRSAYSDILGKGATDKHYINNFKNWMLQMGFELKPDGMKAIIKLHHIDASVSQFKQNSQFVSLDVRSIPLETRVNISQQFFVEKRSNFRKRILELDDQEKEEKHDDQNAIKKIKG